MCPCCGFVKQTDSIVLCTDLEKINNFGESTYLYFKALKNLTILLLIMLIVYAIFSLATNVIASGVLNSNPTISSSAAVGYLAISLCSKQISPTDVNQQYYIIQCWIGLGMVVIWLFMFLVVKYLETKDLLAYDQDTSSASDFSIVIEGVPLDMTK